MYTLKKCVLVLSVSILFFSVTIYGQQSWIRTYGGSEWDFGHSVQITADSGYIITGRTMSYGSGGEDLYLIRIDPSGDTLWTKTYGGTDSDGGCCIEKTTDGGYIIAGRTWSFGAGGGDVWLLKTDSLGDTLWTKTYGGGNEDWGYSVQQTEDGGYIIVGYKMFSPGEGDVYLIKTDSSGNEQWSNTYGGSNYDEARSVCQTPDGGYIICGTDNYNTSNSDLYVIKTDSLGNELWSRTYGGTLMDYGLGISLTLDGGYIIAGKKNISGLAGEAYIIRMDSNGDTLWTRTFGDPADDYAHCARQTSDGGYVVVGAITNMQTYYSNGYIIRLDEQGDSLWTQSYGDTHYANFFSVQQATDTGFICVGSVYSSDISGYDVYAVKTDVNGNVGIKEGIKVETKRQEAKMFASPNPFVSFTTVLGFERENFLVYDIQGRLIKKQQGNRIGKGLSPGMYFLMFEDRDCKTLRVIKIK